MISTALGYKKLNLDLEGEIIGFSLSGVGEVKLSVPQGNNS